jgi:hypothetical protein
VFDPGAPFSWKVLAEERQAEAFALTADCSAAHFSFKVLTGDFIIKKTLGISLALVIGGCVILITVVLVLQVILSLIAAE